MTTIKLFNSAVHSFRDSNDRNTNYYAPSTEFNLEQCGRDGRGRVSVRVAGYWSADVICLYVTREVRWSRDEELPAEWVVTMSHSSGGRLQELSKHYTEEQGYRAAKSDLEAEQNFGYALMATAALGKEIQQQVECLEHWHQVERSERKAKEAAAKAEKQAKIQADAPLGAVAARELMNAATLVANRTGLPVQLNVMKRGTDAYVQAEVGFTRGGSTAWSIHGHRTAKSEVLVYLSESSHRTGLSTDCKLQSQTSS